MLSRLGGAAMTSSGPACSLDSRSGNSRQDETHPDTLTAPALPTVTVGSEVLPRIFSLPQRYIYIIFFFLLPWLLKHLTQGTKEEVFGILEIPQPAALHVSGHRLRGSVLTFVWKRIGSSKERKPRETPFIASSY